MNIDNDLNCGAGSKGADKSHLRLELKVIVIMVSYGSDFSK